MKIIIYDHPIRVKIQGKSVILDINEDEKFEMKTGDTLGLNHTVDVSIREIVKLLLTGSAEIKKVKNKLKK